MHCAVPFFCARSGTEGEAACRCGEGVVRSAGNASRSLRACVGAAWASGSAREGRVAVRGLAKVFGGEWVVRSAGKASRSLRACVGAAWGSGSAREGRVAVWGQAKGFGGECIAQPAGVRRGYVGERKCSGRACRCAGASEGLRRGMGGEVGGFNAHSPQQHARTRIIIYTSTLFAP